MFYLKDLLSLLNTNSGSRNIKIKEHSLNGRTFYDGQVGDLICYLKTHNSFNLCDGFPVQVMNIDGWMVSEIITDTSIERENNLPDYNKSKIIVIF